MRMQIYLLDSILLSSQLSLKLYIPSLYFFLELLASSALEILTKLSCRFLLLSSRDYP